MNLPIFYIGSKKDKTKINNYWGSSKRLNNDIKKIGLENFKKIIIKNIEYNKHEDLLIEEFQYQKKINAVDSCLFYNENYSFPKFFRTNGKHTFDSVWVNNGTHNKRIKKDEFQKFEQIGYKLGRCSFSLKNRIYINNGKTVKSISPFDLEKYINIGWKKGRINGNQLGKRAITKDGMNKYVSVNDLDEFIKNGWVLGQKQK